jgi:hypothetical protein
MSSGWKWTVNDSMSGEGVIVEEKLGGRVLVGRLVLVVVGGWVMTVAEGTSGVAVGVAVE